MARREARDKRDARAVLGLDICEEREEKKDQRLKYQSDTPGEKKAK